MAGKWPGAGKMICVLGDAHLDVVVRVSGPVAEETDTPPRPSSGPAARRPTWRPGSPSWAARPG